MNFTFDISSVETLPYGMIQVDNNLKIINSNSTAIKIFGDLKGKFLYDNDCVINDTEIIAKAKAVVQMGTESTLIISKDSNNNKSSIKNFDFSPIVNNGVIIGASIIIHPDNGNNQLLKDFNLIFEGVPTYISIVDRDFKIIRANQRYRNTFVSNYSIFYQESTKRKITELSSPTHLAFADGKEHTDTHLIHLESGGKIHLIVTSVPFSIKDGAVNLVMEILLDITELSNLQEHLNITHEFYSNLIDKAADGIIAIDNKGKAQLFNSTLKNLLNWENVRKPSINKIKEMLPDEFFDNPDSNGEIVINLDSYALTSNGDKIPIRINAFEITNKKKSYGRYAVIQDLRKIKKLEHQKALIERNALISAFNTYQDTIIDITTELDSILENFKRIVFSDYNSNVRIDSWNRVMIHFNYVTGIIFNYLKIAQGLEDNNKIVKLSEYTDSIINEYIPLAEYYNVNIIKEKFVDSHTIELGDITFRLVLSTLIMNSIDSAMKIILGGSVRVRLELMNDYLTLIVFDNGPSIEKLINKKTKSFKSKENKKLGLMVVDLIAETNNFVFEVSHNENDGNIYCFKFKQAENKLI